MSATQVQETEKPQFYLTEEHHPENSTMLGFWIYLMSDCLIFAVLFATHGVLGRSYAAGPSPAGAGVTASGWAEGVAIATSKG